MLALLGLMTGGSAALTCDRFPSVVFGWSDYCTHTVDGVAAETRATNGQHTLGISHKWFWGFGGGLFRLMVAESPLSVMYAVGLALSFVVLCCLFD